VAMQDELGEEDFEAYLKTYSYMRAYHVLSHNDSSEWWHDVATEKTSAGRAVVVQIAFNETVEQLENEQSQLWKDHFTLEHPHALGKMEALAKIFNVGPLPLDGGIEVLNKQGFVPNGDLKYKFSNKDKLYFRTLDKAVNESTRVTESSLDALVELEKLKDENIYAVRDRAIDLAREGKLSLSDFKNFSNSAGLKLLYERNIFFTQSQPFQDYMSIFKDPMMSSTQLGVELTAIKNRFTGNIVNWFQENKDDEEYKNKPRKFQDAFDAEVKVQLGKVLSGNLIIKGDYETYKDLFLREYGIFIPKPDGT